MARARTLKPGYFRNEDLCALPPLTRILFAGLWGEADREGRLEDRPRRFKVLILPYDPVTADDIDAMLDDLDRAKFIKRYAHPDYPYPLIQVIEFKKHQRPHANEAASCIPAHLQDKKQRPRSLRATTKVTSASALVLDLGSEIPTTLPPEKISPTATGAKPTPAPAGPKRLDRQMHALWLEHGYKGNWPPWQWSKANDGIKLLKADERAVLESWAAYLLETDKFYQGHPPSKWADNPGSWPRPAKGIPELLKSGTTWRPPEERAATMKGKS